MWYSGPHIGVTHDVRLFRENTPPLQRGEKLLGDKAYVGNPLLIAPHKMARGVLSQRKRAFNVVHSWYRVTIEHCFAFVKRSDDAHRCAQVRIIQALTVFCDFCVFACRYRILSGVYRGKYFKRPEPMQNALKIIMHLSVMHTKRSPLRTHQPLVVLPAPVVAAIPSPPPDVDTGMRYQDLSLNQRVEVWWLGDWWAATVKYLRAGDQSATIRFMGAQGTMSGVMPHHLRNRT